MSRPFGGVREFFRVRGVQRVDKLSKGIGRRNPPVRNGKGVASRMTPKSSIRFLSLVILAAVSSAPPALGRDKKHFSNLRMVWFAKPVSTPEFRLKDLEGKEVSFSGFEGKVILLNFYTTW